MKKRIISIILALLMMAVILPAGAEMTDEEAVAYLAQSADDILSVRALIALLCKQYNNSVTYVWDYPIISAYAKNSEDPWALDLGTVEVIDGGGNPVELSRSLSDANFQDYADVVSYYWKLKECMPTIIEMANSAKPDLPEKYSHAYSLIEKARETIQIAGENTITFLEGQKEIGIKTIEQQINAECLLELSATYTVFQGLQNQ